MSVGVPGMSAVDGGGLPTTSRIKMELTPEIVAAIKSELEAMGLPQKIYKFTYEDDVFVFRPLYRSDWNKIQAYMRDNQSTLTQDAIDEKVCRTAVIFPDVSLHPTQWEIQRAGYQSALASYVLAKSGFLNPDLDQSDMLRVEALGEVVRGRKPTPEERDALKEKYADWNGALRLLMVGEEYYVVRPLTRGEWKSIQNGDEPDLDLATAERATIWSQSAPERPVFDNALAGSVRAISEVVMQISGFNIQAQVEAL